MQSSLSPRQTVIERDLRNLLKKFGYRYDSDNGRLTEVGIRGFTSDYVLPYKFRSLRSACEHLIPIIKDDEFRTGVSPDPQRQ